ncbi:MAG: hypothetical protein GY750_04535 [Lentisphaerae bacterium]|nr:hypothetical protein [Lentisphaerota bacterium]MCP4100678.1 hypothetical protein [Lentisphaerota bacterium]
MKIFRPTAVAWYDAQMGLILSSLLSQVQIPIKIIRNNPVYRAARRKLADVIIAALRKEKYKIADILRDKLQTLIDQKLEELNQHINERIE